MIHINTEYYFDNAATTKVNGKVMDAMIPAFRSNYGNPSSLYSLGKKAADSISHTKNIIAKEINCSPEEIYFTSGGTEGNNWIKSMADVWVRSAIEHKSVFKDDNDIIAPVNKEGTVMLPLAFLQRNYKQDKINIVSCQYVNNEIGTIQNIKYLCKFAHENGFLFHSDAVQAFGKIKIDVKELGVDYMTFTGHKIGAPKGIGFVYIKKSAPIKPFITGGQQQNGMRTGTENVPYIIGLGKAVELFDFGEYNNIAECQKMIIDLLSKAEGVRFNNPLSVSAVPHIVNVAFKNITSESLMILLDMDGIAVSAGSACNSHSLQPSHVLQAIGVPDDYINGAIRISMYHTPSEKDIDFICERIKHHVNTLRSLHNEI